MFTCPGAEPVASHPTDTLLRSVSSDNSTALPVSPVSYASSLPSSSPPPLCPAILPAEAADSATATAHPDSAMAGGSAGGASLASVTGSFADKDAGSSSALPDAGALVDAVNPASAAPHVPTSPVSNESLTTPIEPRSGPRACSAGHDVLSGFSPSPSSAPLSTGSRMLSRGVQTHVMLTKRGKPSPPATPLPI